MSKVMMTVTVESAVHDISDDLDDDLNEESQDDVHLADGSISLKN